MTKLQIRSAVVRGVVLAMLGATVALVPVAGSAAEPAAAAAAREMLVAEAASAKRSSRESNRPD